MTKKHASIDLDCRFTDRRVVAMTWGHGLRLLNIIPPKEPDLGDKPTEVSVFLDQDAVLTLVEWIAQQGITPKGAIDYRLENLLVEVQGAIDEFRRTGLRTFG